MTLTCHCDVDPHPVHHHCSLSWTSLHWALHFCFFFTLTVSSSFILHVCILSWVYQTSNFYLEFILYLNSCQDHPHPCLPLPSSMLSWSSLALLMLLMPRIKQKLLQILLKVHPFLLSLSLSKCCFFCFVRLYSIMLCIERSYYHL